MRFEALSREYATLWDTMEITRDQSAMDKTVARIVAHRDAYEQVSHATGVPWHVIGILDMREGGGGACTHLHNGDNLKRPTVQVPKGRPTGRGPFTFFQSACDALAVDGLTKVQAWSVERMAFEFERYNGMGYRARKIRSPYLWGGTNHQEPGKYVADGKFSRTAIDPQHGCMPLLKILAERCHIGVGSVHRATPDAHTPSPASNPKAQDAPVMTAGNVTAGGAGAAALLWSDPVGLSTSLVAVKGNAGQLLAGVDLASLIVPLVILACVGGVIVYARGQHGR